MNIDFGFATRDDCLERMVPSDLRQLVCERDTAELKAKQLGAKVEGFGDTIEVLQAERDSWRRVAERIETEKQQLEARVAELEAALTEASNNGAEGDDGAWFYGFNSERLDELLNRQPRQSLANIQAEALKKFAKDKIWNVNGTLYEGGYFYRLAMEEAAKLHKEAEEQRKT